MTGGDRGQSHCNMGSALRCPPRLWEAVRLAAGDARAQRGNP